MLSIVYRPWFAACLALLWLGPSHKAAADDAPPQKAEMADLLKGDRK